MRKILALMTLCFSFTAVAHEGAHGPEQKVAPHGGILREGPTLNFEMVKSAQGVKIYPLTHDGKAIEAKVLEIDSKKITLTDAKKKPVKFELVAQGDAYAVQFEKGSSHRYSLNFTAGFEGKENKGSWQIELGSE